jgi:hypothetical protein
MNPLIKDQLSKVRRVKLPPFDDTTQVITVQRGDVRTISDTLQEDCCYLISVEDYILNPPDGFTLHTNWNNNTVPKHKVMKVDITKIMGKMVKVNSVGYDMKNHLDLPDMWSGWLPRKSITIIEVL